MTLIWRWESYFEFLITLSNADFSSVLGVFEVVELNTLGLRSGGERDISGVELLAAAIVLLAGGDEVEHVLLREHLFLGSVEFDFVDFVLHRGLLLEERGAVSSN